MNGAKALALPIVAVFGVYAGLGLVLSAIHVDMPRRTHSAEAAKQVRLEPAGAACAAGDHNSACRR